jgi:DNA polymerase-1
MSSARRQKTRGSAVDRLLLVDGNNLLVRAIKATERADMSANGVNTAPLVVFINTLTKHVREEQPDRLVIAWDSQYGSDYRLALDSEYKANRTKPSEEYAERKDDAFYLAKTFLSLSNVFMATGVGVEADDIIAAYWRPNRWSNKVIILSSDKDFMQLVTDGTEQIRLSAGGAPTDRWSEQRVIDELGYKPEDIPNIMALTGDKGDNVPGIAGIGPKTAVKILAAADWQLSCIEHPKVDGRMAEVERNLSLVDLREPHAHVEIAPAPIFNPTAPGAALAGPLMSFFEMYRLANIESQWIAGNLWSR